MENTTTFDNLIIEYIQKTYSVSRIKDNKRFRRAMVLDDGRAYHLKDEPTTKKIKYQLGSYISLIFACDEQHAQQLIFIALGI